MSIAEQVIKFKEIERTIQNLCNELGRTLMKTALERWDLELSESRDRSGYRHKGKRKTVLKTVLGEVEYERALYETTSEDGIKSYVYLLDDALGISSSGYMSGLLTEQIVQAVCASSYREAARSVSEMTGQRISHTAAWNVVQALGSCIGEQEERAAALAAVNEGAGELETKLLFEEQDGIWLHLQGKSREEHGRGKEMKLAIAYDGARQTGKKRYELTNKVACANFEGVKAFVGRKEGVIASVYNTDEIEMRFLNGDGAAWIKQSAKDESVHFQLDPFHRNRAVRQYVADPEAREVIMELLYSKQIDLLLTVIEAYSNSTGDESERETYLSLLEYFSNNTDGLIPIHRRGLGLPEPPEGKEYRHMGAMESNIFTILGNRMKGRRACWSIDGGNNLARLLCLKFTNRLSDTLRSLAACVLPERYADEITLELSAAKVPLREGKGYNGFHQTLIPASMGWLKDLASLRPLSEI